MSMKFPNVPLSQVLTPIERPEAPQPGTTYRLFGVKWWGEGVYEREAVDGSQTQYAKLSRIEANDIVINKIWARHGSVAVVQEHLAGCYGGSEFPTFLPDPTQLEPRWIHWLSKTAAFWGWCAEKSYGTSGKNRIRPEQFLAVEIPLPPLNEQRRIVAHIEALAARIAEARGLRQQAVAEAEAFWYSSLQQTRHELLMGGWEVKQIGELASVTSGGTPSREVSAYWNGEIPWIKTGELIDGDILGAEEFITEDGLNNSSTKLFPIETILIALYGQGQTRGRTGRLMIEAATNQACCAILPTERFDSRFLQYWIRSLYSEMREVAHGGAQPNWNSSTIKRIEIPLLPISEQHYVVADLDDLHTRVDTLKRLQTETAAELDALLPAVLDRAFRGELL